MHHSNWMLAVAILALGCTRVTARENDTSAQATAAEAAPQAASNKPVDPKLLAGPRCKAHGAIESLCTKCNPKLEPVFRAKGDWCAEHEFPESICPICHPELAEKAPTEGSDRPSSSVAPGTVIRFKSPGLEQAAGITVTDAARAAFESGVSAVARIEFDPNRVADVRAPVAGLVKEIHVELGSAVKRGTVLFTLTSVEVGQLQGQLRAARQRVLTAKASLDRESKLERAGIGARVNVERADRSLAEAQAEAEALRSSLGVSGAFGGGAGRMQLKSPIAGIVVERKGVLGTLASSETSLATVADPSVVSALIDVRESDAARVKNEHPVLVEVDGVPDHSFLGKVEWVAPAVDPRTRTVLVRARLENVEGLLRNNQFARALITVEPSRAGLVVPVAAVQRQADGSLLFVRTGPGVYEPRPVKVGRRKQSLVEVEGDLRPGDDVVTEGAFLLKTELSKDGIGAGCCEVEKPGGKR